MNFCSLFDGKECSLNDILNARERRAETYSKLLTQHECTNVLTLCVNMPGNVKNNLASRTFFYNGLKLIENVIENPTFKQITTEETGPEALFVTNIDSVLLKKSMLTLEKEYPWMRMLDIDVIDKTSGHIGRTQLGKEPSKCFVCNKEAKLCSSQVSHSEEEIKEAISRYYIDLISTNLGVLAYDSLIHEANCTPKPGLVDKNNNGSHKDMNLALLQKSASVLQPYFTQMAQQGFENQNFQSLRSVGKEAEAAMLQATGNVNTHKGAIFALGLMVYSYGNCVFNNKEPNAENICSTIKTMVKGIEKEIPAEIQKQRGLGARGQAADGYRIITETSLPFYRKQLGKYDTNRALSLTLLQILAHNEDSNIAARSNVETLRWAQTRALDLANRNASEEEIIKLDQEFISKNISPGGSADLLAATYFLANLQTC